MILFFRISTFQIKLIQLLAVMALLTTLPINAQDLPKKITIDDNSKGLLDNKPAVLPSLRIDPDQKTPEKNTFDLSTSKEIEFVPKEKFADRGKALEKKLNKREKEIKEEYKSDQYLGDFKSNAKFVKIICRDHEFVDGDRVKVYVNDVAVQYDIPLSEKFYGFEITLEKGFNKVDFEALNQGSSGPNTAEFRVYDDQGKLVSSNRWNLTTGVKATLIIVKE